MQLVNGCFCWFCSIVMWGLGGVRSMDLYGSATIETLLEDYPCWWFRNPAWCFSNHANGGVPNYQPQLVLAGFRTNHQQYYPGWWFQIFFIFIPILGKMPIFDEHIFQMGWFNHQPVSNRTNNFWFWTLINPRKTNMEPEKMRCFF